MQTYQQTFAVAQTWELNIPGKYFTTLECLFPLNVRFYRGGTLLDAGEVRGMLAGLEMMLGNIGDFQPAFDRVQIDVQAGDTVKIGIGNGQGRYNRAGEITKNTVPRSEQFDNLQKSVATASGVLLAANTSRQYLLIQNKDTSANVFIAFGKPATAAAGVRVIPGGAFEMVGICTTQEIHAIASVATSNITVVEG